MGLLKKITKPISKILDKIIPNEIKPALPFLSAAAPFMLGPGIMGSTMLKRALMSGALNLGSQLSQEGSEGDFNPLSLALASGIGALSAPGTGEIVGQAGETVTAAQPGAEKFLMGKAEAMDPGWMKSGTQMLGKGAKYLTKAADTLQNEPFTKAGLKASIVPFSQGLADSAMISAQQALDEFNAGLEEGSEAWYDDDARRIAIRRAMEMAGHVEEDIVSALAALGLKEGGRVGFDNGGGIFDAPQLEEASQRIELFDKRKKSPIFDPMERLEAGMDVRIVFKAKELMEKEGIQDPEFAFKLAEDLIRMEDDPERNVEFLKGMDEGFYLERPSKYTESDEYYTALEGLTKRAKGGRINKEGGGMMSVLPRGLEMDYRGGGMIPMGSKERADDVPARLSKNEFVMTADAVRAAGGGSVNVGAKRMYDLMHNLEARV